MRSAPALAALVLLGLPTVAVGDFTARPDRSAAEGVGNPVPPACEDGIVKDDGSVESGWGWVPSVESGEYVQVWDRSEFPTAGLDSVCVCWLRTREDDTIDFDLVVYRDLDGQPEPEPYAVVPAQATDVPKGIVGRFYEVDVTGVDLPEEGTVYIGPRWDASADQFFFVCADTTPTTPFTNVFFIDDRAKGIWDNIAETDDPIFDDHRAILVRPVPRAPFEVEVPTLGGAAGLALVVLLAGLGLLSLRRLP